MWLWSEIRRRNVDRMAVLYVVAAWLIMQVAEVLISLRVLPPAIGPVTFTVLGIGFPIALIFSWFYELTPEGLTLEKDVDPAESITHITGRRMDLIVISLLSAAVLMFAWHTWWPSIPTDRSIAVLAFENLSDDPEQEYFSEGISEELIHTLSAVDGLRVTSRTSAFSFKGKSFSIPEIARQLSVNHVLEGSVRRVGDTVRVTAQLIDARTDSHLWSESYDRRLGDVFKIQQEIAAQIVRSLEMTLAEDVRMAIARAQKQTDNLEAYELYLKGRYFWQRRHEDNIRRAIDLFERSTEMDPQFARAWSSLAAAHLSMPGWARNSPEAGLLLGKEKHYPLAISAANKALALDDSLADAYGVLGVLAFMERDFTQARLHFHNAISNEPNNSNARAWYGEHLISVGHIRDGLKEVLLGYQLDPFNPNTVTVLALTYFRLDDAKNMLKYGADAWDLGVGIGIRVQAMAYLRLNEYERAIEMAEIYDEFYEVQRVGLKMYIQATVDAALRSSFIEGLHQIELQRPFWYSVSKYSGLGRVDDAYRLVNLYLHRNSLDPDWHWWVLWRPDMAAFRQDPRFLGIIAEIGFLPYWREYGWPDVCEPAGEDIVCE